MEKLQDDDVLDHAVGLKIISVTSVTWTLHHGFGFEPKQPSFSTTNSVMWNISHPIADFFRLLPYNVHDEGWSQSFTPSLITLLL